MPEMPAACPATGPGKPAPIPGRGSLSIFPGLDGHEHPRRAGFDMKTRDLKRKTWLIAG